MPGAISSAIDARARKTLPQRAPQARQVPAPRSRIHVRLERKELQPLEQFGAHALLQLRGGVIAGAGAIEGACQRVPVEREVGCEAPIRAESLTAQPATRR
jgi:hypothetical protein